MGVNMYSVLVFLCFCASCVLAQNTNDCADMEVCFMLDTSGSIIRNDDVNRVNWHLVLNFTQNIVKMLDVPNQKIGFALIYYANFAKVHFTLDYSKDIVLEKIRNTTFLDQNTNTSGAIWLMRQKIFTEEAINRCPNTYRVGMVVTDGVSTRQPERVKPEADLAKKSGIRMFAIGVGSAIKDSELVDIASTPIHRHKYTVKDFVDLQTLFLDLLKTRNNTEPETTTTTSTTSLPTTTTATTITTTVTIGKTTIGTIHEVQDCVNPADVAIMIDSSGSVSPSDFKKSLIFAQTLVGNLDITSGKVRVGLVTFGSTPTNQIRLNQFTNPKDLSNEIARIPFIPKRTDTASAFRFLRDTFFQVSNGDRSNVPNVAIVLTDGDSDDHDASISGAIYARNGGITVMTVGAGTWIEPHQLNSMSSYPHDKNSFRASNYASLVGLSPTLARAACDNLNECSFNPCQNGAKCINKINTYECVCADGFRGRNCQLTRREHAEVVFALDESGSINPNDFYKMVDFVQTLVFDLQPSSAGTGIGVLSYSDGVRVRTQLRQYVTASTLVNGMTFRYRGGTTRTSSALRYVCENMFTRDGDRTNVRNIAVFFTDGASNNQAATLDEARRCRQAGVTLLVVSIGNMNRRSVELNGMASDPNDKNIFMVQNYTLFQTIRNDLRDTITNEVNECLVNPCNRGSCTDGINTFVCACPAGVSGRLCDRGCSNELDLTFLIDMSGSVQRRNAFKVLDFVTGVVRTLDVAFNKTRIGVVVFSDTARTEFNLNRYTNKEDVIQAISMIKYNGGKTNTADGLRLVQRMYTESGTGNRENVPSYCILITDGRSTVNKAQTIPEAMTTRRRGISTIVVVIGTSVNDVEIHGLASEPKDKMIIGLQSYAAMTQSIDTVSKSFCNEVDECASRPCENSGVCIDGLNGYTCQCRDTFTGKNCERRCTRQIDMVFVLDVSGSVQSEYVRAIRLIKKINMGLNHKFSRTRVGFVSYGDSVRNHFYLNTYTNYVDINNGLEIYQAGGTTATSDALRALYTDVFTTSRGDRTAVKNVAVVLTDGQARDRALTKSEAVRARNTANLEIFSVGIGDFNLLSELNNIASTPSNLHMMIMSQDSQVDSVANRILNIVCL